MGGEGKCFLFLLRIVCVIATKRGGWGLNFGGGGVMVIININSCVIIKRVK